MHRNAYLRASSQKSDPPFAPATSISYKTNVHYRVTFMGYIRCFCATRSHNRMTLTFDLLTLRVCHIQCFSCPTHIPILIILLSVTELRFLNLFTFMLSETVTAHAPCHVTYNRGQKEPTFLKSPTPIYLFTLSLSGR